MAGDVELEITAGEVSLSATLTLPETRDGDVRWPAALLLPSFLPRDRNGGFDRESHPGWFAPPADGEAGVLVRFATALAARGVASLRYDKRGCGRSGGDWAAAGLFTLVDDARDAMAVLRAHVEIDPARIGVVGHGEGAWLAFSLAAADPAVGPLTTVGSPARGLRDVLRRGVAERARRRGQTPANGHPFVAVLDRGLEELIERAERGETDMTLTLPGGDPVRMGLSAWEQSMQIPVRALATLQQRSVTVVHGEQDRWVNPEESDLLVAALDATSAPRRIFVPWAGHDLEEATPDLFRDLAADLAVRLQPRRLPTVLLSIGLR